MAEKGYQGSYVGGTYDGGKGGYGYEPHVGLDAQPAYTQTGQNDQKFASSGCRDIVFLILFFAHFVGVGLIILFGNLTPVVCDNGPNATVSYNGFLLPCETLDKGFAAAAAPLIQMVGLLFIIGIFASSLYLSLVRAFPGPMVWAGIIVNLGLLLLTAVFFFVNQQIAGGVISVILLAFVGLFFFFVRNRIAFAIEVLRVASSVIGTYPGTQVVAYCSILFKILWLLLWSYAAYTSQRLTGNGSIIAAVFLIFSFYWTLETIKNVVHVSVSGVVATWYFLGDHAPSSPTFGSVRRALTTSLGSIALGSLIVAVIKTLRALVKMGTRNNRQNLLTCLCSCFLACLDRLVRYFNHYAFCQVAIYGHTYWEAAKATWNLMHTSGLSAIVNDNILDGVLWMGIFLCGLIVSGAGFLLSYFWPLFAFVLPPPAAIGVGFAVGVLLGLIAVQCLDSAIACTFVCFAEDKAILQARHPALYQRLMETYYNIV